MQYIEAPSQEKPIHRSVFLAGGITNCPDWQAEIVELLKDQPLSIFNPRRENFPIDDPSAAREQIEWEYRRLHEVNLISFWFSVGSLNPIVLFEYGAALERIITRRDQLTVVGCHPEYTRRQDVIIQTVLKRPRTVIADSLPELSYAIIGTADFITQKANL